MPSSESQSHTPRPRLNGTVASASWPLPPAGGAPHLRFHISLLDGHWSLLSGHWSARMAREADKLIELHPGPDADFHGVESRLVG